MLGDDGETGTIAALAPVGEPPGSKYERLIARAKDLVPSETIVAFPCEETALRGPLEAAEAGIIRPILVGPTGAISALARKHGLKIAGCELVDRLLGRHAGVEQHDSAHAVTPQVADELRQQRLEGRCRQMLAAGKCREGRVEAEADDRRGHYGQLLDQPLRQRARRHPTRNGELHAHIAQRHRHHVEGADSHVIARLRIGHFPRAVPEDKHRLEECNHHALAGVLKKLKCKVGDIVGEGVELAEIEPAAAS